MGRVARWVDWRVFWMTKENWEGIHTVFSYLFSLFAIFHIFSINWKAFFSYLKSKISSGFNKKREFTLSVLIVVLIFFGTLFSIPPIKSVMEFGSVLSKSWEKIEEEPPVSQAEKLTLTEFSTAIEMDLTVFMEKLKVNGISYLNLDQTMEEVAKQNHISPLQLYDTIKE